MLQFERQQSRDVALILDPWLPYRPHEQNQGLLELALSFTATALADLTGRGHTRIVFAVAASQPQVWAGPASPLLCQDLLAQLAVLPASDGHTLAQTLAMAREQAPLGCRLIVVSPRRAAGRCGVSGELAWIDVSSEDLAGLFAWE